MFLGVEKGCIRNECDLQGRRNRKTFVEDAFPFSWEKHCVVPYVESENPP